jgi:hypothetical protein
MAKKLARGHVSAHEQFLHDLGLKHGGRRLKDVSYNAQVKNPVHVRKMNVEMVDLSTKAIGRAPAVRPEVVDEEIISLLESFDAESYAVKMVDIVDACSGFGWTHSQIRTSIRRLRSAGRIVREGNCRSSGYLLAGRDIPAGVSAEGL